ncbi:MAG: diguanylate cyclase [Chloroflexi bacterium]|nr:diguanylate cyclase [Chloroflexota bacterium]
MLIKQSKLHLTIWALGMVVVIGVMDYYTSPETTTFVFYLIPIVFATWFIGKRIGVLVSVASTLVWSIANVHFAFNDPNLVVFYWNATARFISFLIMASVLSAFKTTSSQLEQEQITSRTDSLTGLANRRHFFEIAEHELERTQRYAHPLAAVYIDVDEFKKVNDVLGHADGDRLLQAVSETILKQIRTTDTAARLGGDEFVILLPETDQATARIVVERIHQCLLTTAGKYLWRVTFSIGVVTFLKPPSTADEMVSIADACMYVAKRDGKNRVEFQTIEKAKP